MEIIGKNGTVKQITIEHFSALDGWDIQRKFIEFAASTDRHTRRTYTLEVLSYAKISVGDNMLPFSTDALIDNHLETWENVEKVFEAVLMENGINPNTHADKPHYWASAGAEMAVAFIAEASKLIGPAMEITGNVYSKE